MPTDLFVTAIIAAGGRGERVGRSEPKQLLTIAGRAVLDRSVRAFLDHDAISEVIVALPADLVDAPPAYLRGASKPLRLVAGGVRRQDSVAAACAAAAPACDVIVIHDAARPFVSGDLITRTIAAAAESGAAVAALPSRDTVKRARANEGGQSRGADRSTLMVGETLPRDSIFLAQTPQAFRRAVIEEALEAGRVGPDATDEAALAERAGHQVRIVLGEPTNMKITTPEDLVVAEAVARSRDEKDGTSVPAMVRGRAGIGYDLHRLVEGRPLILGGVTIPFDRGLLGHSDADAVCHAITDALLGAAGAGDIGRHFPDHDPQWRGASSVDLLQRAAAIVRERGFEVQNVDATVIAERPKLLPHIEAMCRNVAGAIGIAADRVSIKGKTNEGVGELGRGEAIAVHAIASLTASS